MKQFFDNIMSRKSSSFGKTIGRAAARGAALCLLPFAFCLFLAGRPASAAAPLPGMIAFATNLYVVYDTFQGDYHVTTLYGGDAAPVSVDYSVDVANPTNTAVYGVDYFLNPGTITFQAGVLQTNFVVTILPTATVGRVLCLQLSNPTAPAVVDPAQAQAQLIILPEPPPKPAAGEFSFSRFEYNITVKIRRRRAADIFILTGGAPSRGR